MAVGADIAQAEPAMIGAIGIGTEMPRRIDGAFAATGEGDDRWRCPGGLGMRVDTVLTGLTQGLLDISGKGFGFFRALTSGFYGFSRGWRSGPTRIGPPDMDDEADQY
jgi:hypothetical protein